jgi:LmbE family N-acetylglucosaminyl deacetylase
MKQPIMVIAAHPDDELLGVAGTLLKHKERGDDVSILILGDGEISRDENPQVEKRESNAQKMGQKLGVKNLFLEKFLDNQFDSSPLLDIVKVVGKHVDQVKPTIIYTHHPYDLNVDHRLTAQAVLCHCRPMPGLSVKKIATFETVSTTEWQVKRGETAFCPNEYQNITKYIDGKIELLKIYDDEMRPYPHPRSFEGIRVLAQMRGIEVGYEYAEAFEIIRVLHD